MIELNIDVAQLRAFNDAIFADQPIEPGPGGWTVSKVMALAGVCQDLASTAAGRDKRSLAEIEDALLHDLRPEPLERYEARLETEKVDVLAATAVCRHLSRLASSMTSWEQAFECFVTALVAWNHDAGKANVRWIKGSRREGDEWAFDATGRRVS